MGQYLAAVMQRYASGGSVKRFAGGDRVIVEDSPGDYRIENYGRVQPDGSTYSDDPYNEDTVAPPPQSELTPSESGGVEKMFQNYFSDPYAYDVWEARQAARNERQALEDMIQKAVSDNEEGKRLSQAEMYFRLAAAFGSPTKTKNGFMENVGMAGQALAETAKERRAEQKEKVNLQLAAQKLKNEYAKEDLAAALKFYGAHQKQGQPLSTPGKAAIDMGLKPGTPEYNEMVKKLATLEVQYKGAIIGEKQETARREERKLGVEEHREARETEKQNRLSPSEMTRVQSLEAQIADLDAGTRDLTTAYSLNKNSLPSSWSGSLQYKLLGGAGSKNPQVVNTQRLENLLGGAALKQLKSTFGGQGITEGERGVLMGLQGIGSKNLEQRKQIILHNIQNNRNVRARLQKQLDEIKSGKLRTMEGE